MRLACYGTMNTHADAWSNHDGEVSVTQKDIMLGARSPQDTTTAGAPDSSSFFSDSTSENTSPTSGRQKSILEYLFLSITFIIVTCLILRRLVQLRRTNQSLRIFFSSGDGYRFPSADRMPPNVSRTTGLPTSRQGLPYPPYPDAHLATFPAAYMGGSANHVRAFDIGLDGRRIHRTTEIDHGGELGDKDILPPYDTYGGPPKYVESGMSSRLTRDVNERSHPVQEPVSRLSDNFDIPPGPPNPNPTGTPEMHRSDNT